VEIVHRIVRVFSAEEAEEVHRIGVPIHWIDVGPLGHLVQSNGQRHGRIEIRESDSRWPRLNEWLGGKSGLHTVGTEFTKREVESAEWLVLSTASHGYPQPEAGYLTETYEGACVGCGWRGRQLRPLRLKGEPKWGRRSLFSLNWLPDELLVRPSVWSELFAPVGVASLPVTDKKGRELSTVVQLASTVPDVDLVGDACMGETCDACGRWKHLPHSRGFFPPPSPAPMAALARSLRCFGSGGMCFRAILVSQGLARRILAARLRECQFWPVRSD